MVETVRKAAVSVLRFPALLLLNSERCLRCHTLGMGNLLLANEQLHLLHCLRLMLLRRVCIAENHVDLCVDSANSCIVTA